MTMRLTISTRSVLKSLGWDIDDDRSVEKRILDDIGRSL